MTTVTAVRSSILNMRTFFNLKHYPERKPIISKGNHYLEAALYRFLQASGIVDGLEKGL